MANIRPFKAIRPTRDKAHLVATRSYLTYSEEGLNEKLKNNPYTFLHIINPNYNKNNKKGKKRFRLIKKRFHDFIDQGYFIEDKKPSFYLYQQINTTHTFTGIIAAISVLDYINGTIKIHEDTITKRENMFKDYLETTGFNADPVLLSYKGNDKINKLLSENTKKHAEYDFTTTDKVSHKLWVLDNKNDISYITQFFKEKNTIYIADGHHRTASSCLLSTQIGGIRDSPCNYFMAYLIPENQLNIINFNRLITHRNNNSVQELLTKIQKNYIINKISKHIYKPLKKHEISMYVSGIWYSLIAKKESYNNDCINRLDTMILSNNILSPILGIKNEKIDESIHFKSGKTSLQIIKDMVDSKKYKIAFILQPISIQEVKEVANNKKIMPPKSTYIEPKLRSGLIIYSIEG